jgi:anionic cell wall polymer biosynthesis LytR-Cps2A-Psr (LCP) family protein
MKKNIIIYIAIIGFLVIGLAAAGIVAILALRGVTNPLQNKNEVNPTYASFPTEIQQEITTVPEALSPIYTPTEKPTQVVPTSTSAIQAPQEVVVVATAVPDNNVCGMTGQMNILVIGQDDRQGLLPYGADAIRMVKIDFNQHKAAVFALERDLLLPTTNLQSSYGISEAHLGSVYDIVSQKVAAQSDAKLIATNAMAQVIYDNFGLVPDYYVNLNKFVVPNIIDQIGGLDLLIPANFSTPLYTFVPGQQHLDGPAVWEYLAYPSSTQDEWSRFSRQELVFAALRIKLLNPDIFPNLLSLYNTIANSVLTDLSIEQISGLICEMEQIPPENVAFNTFPQSMITTYTDSSMVLKDMPAAVELVNNAFDW